MGFFCLAKDVKQHEANAKYHFPFHYSLKQTIKKQLNACRITKSSHKEEGFIEYEYQAR